MSELLANELRDQGYADVVLVGLRRHDEGRTLKTQLVARRDGAAPDFRVIRFTQ